MFGVEEANLKFRTRRSAMMKPYLQGVAVITRERDSFETNCLKAWKPMINWIRMNE